MAAERAGSWQRRHGLAVLARVAAIALPALAGVGGVLAVAHVTRGSAGWGRTLLLVAVAVIVPAVVMRATRRLLPLAFLLELDLLFPQALPSRFRVALQAGSTRALDDEPADAAETIVTLAASIAAHDRWTRAHSERVRAYAEVIGHHMGLGSTDVGRLRWAALLHDVGKLHVPSDVLRKPAALADHEWDVVRRHPDEGDRLVAPLRGFLGQWADTVKHHHERWDGTGYPRGLRGDEICLGARIVAVADAYDVMTNASRPYRAAVSAEDARADLAKQAGSQFDPMVVRMFLDVPLSRLQRVAGLSGLVLSLGTAARFARADGVDLGGEIGGTGGGVRGGPIGARLPEGAQLPDGSSSSAVDQPHDSVDQDGDDGGEEAAAGFDR